MKIRIKDEAGFVEQTNQLLKAAQISESNKYNTRHIQGTSLNAFLNI